MTEEVQFTLSTQEMVRTSVSQVSSRATANDTNSQEVQTIIPDH